MSDLISRQAAIDVLWKAMYEYEDKMEKQFIESDDLDIEEWILHRIFVQNMNDIDRKAILDLPSAEKHGLWINYKDEHRCSCCGEVIIGDWFYEDDAYSYCPNCGASMVNEVEE